MNDPARCPTCSEPTLVVRLLERAGVTVHECEACSGIWLPREVVQALVQKIRTERVPEGEPPPTVSGSPELYRACPSCNVLMTRRGCGEVILDVCDRHGVWFDPGELDPFLHWAGKQASGPMVAPVRRVPGEALAMIPPPPVERESSWGLVFDGLDVVGTVGECLVAILSCIADI